MGGSRRQGRRRRARVLRKLFGWQIDVNPDPMYGGYALAKVDGVDAAGIGPTQSPDQPSMWSIYIGTDDVDRLAEKVTAAGGVVIAPPFDVGDQGRMAVFMDPTGAQISAWQGPGWADSRRPASTPTAGPN
jgi:predicted enzyme related to lactoylglutathione lyase